jgi:hypothetical protein
MQSLSNTCVPSPLIKRKITSNWNPGGPGGGLLRTKCAAPAPALDVVSVVSVIHPAGGDGAIVQTPSFGVKSTARCTANAVFGSASWISAAPCAMNSAP